MARSRARKVVLLVALVLVVGGACWYWLGRAGPTGPGLRTAPVERGDLLATVSATGTIEPEEVIDVGAQVVGMITEFGRDPHDSTRPIDFLSSVVEGTVLARIDDAVYRARADRADALLQQADAQLEQARANLRRSEADLLQLEARLVQADQDWKRARRLRPTASIAEAEYDSFKAAYEVARANVSVGKAAVDQARAAQALAERGVAVSRADLREAEQNLAYCTIRSPVKGVIVDRRVNVGQTVVSSLSAPSLFLIAKDLNRLQVWGSVNEADIGRIRAGQVVRFTVDAFPDETFQGQVSQLRLNATMTQNVVTYTVVVDTPNPDGRLLPYLTTSLQFEVGRRRGALLVPNAALRWQPQPAQVAPDARPDFAPSHDRREPGGAAPAGEKKPHDRGVVWVPAGNFVRPVEVQLGLSDGLKTEVLGDALQEGQPVVVGEKLPAEGGDAASPFTPRPFGRGR